MGQGGSRESTRVNHLSGSSKNQVIQISESTKTQIKLVFSMLNANPKVSLQKLDGLLSKIPKIENIFLMKVEGYNILQKIVGCENAELLKWILQRNPDLNKYSCSLPLHIACKSGFKEGVELLLKHGARADLESRLCFPGSHNFVCDEYNCLEFHGTEVNPESNKLQNAVYYCLDVDQPEVLELLTKTYTYQMDWIPWHTPKRPLLHAACERGAWKCVEFLVQHRPFEINECYDEFYPIHQAMLHDTKFSEKLLKSGANHNVRTTTQQMTVLHVLFLLSKKSADMTLANTKTLMSHNDCLQDIINEPDSLGNTPLHALIVRYALEEASLCRDHPPWSKWDMLYIVRFLLFHGGRNSINHPGNSALAYVLRHVRDWEFRYELLSMLLQEGGNPNIVGRDGTVPLMVCLVPLINKDLLLSLTHTMKVFYVNCVRLLLKHGANANCTSRSNLTPLHVLIFAAGEYMGLNNPDEKDACFDFLKQLLITLLTHGLDPNQQFSNRTQHILLGILELVLSVRDPRDLNYIYDLSLLLIRHGANPNVDIIFDETQACHNSQISSFPKSNKVIYHYIQWLYRKENLLLDPDKNFACIIKLYANCMDYNDLQSTFKLVYSQSTTVENRANLCVVLKEHVNEFRSLKRLSRHVVYKNCSAKNFNVLPVPSAILKYINSYD